MMSTANHDHKHDGECHCRPTAAVQSLDEMDFERGIWTAAIDNDLNRLNHLIKLGEQNAVDKNGYTALHYAARNGHLEVCKRLLNAGAHIDAITKSGGVTPLMRAAMMGHENIVQLLLNNKANIMLQDNDGNTALHKAAQHKHHKIIQILLDYDKNNELKTIQNKKDQIAEQM